MDKEQKTWEFLLTGDIHDFRDLSEKRGTSLFSIYGGIDDYLDCKNDDFRMSTIFCQNEENTRNAWQYGYELIDLFNGASTLCNRSYLKASIVRVIHNEIAVDHTGQEPIQALLGKPNIPPEELRVELESAKKTDLRLKWMHWATEHEDVYVILKLFNMEAGWATYYKTLESVEEFAKKNSINLDSNIEAKRKSFTNTANNYSLSGLASRHGFKEALKKNKTPTMTLEEAYDFISRVAKEYLSKLSY